MTLPASLPLSMSQIATELGLALPLSLNHAWVLALAQKTALPVSFSDLLGKTGRFDGNVNITGTGIGALSNAPFFGGTLNSIENQGGQLSINCVNAPVDYTGSIKLTNHTTGISAVLPYYGGSPVSWVLNSPPANITPFNATSSYSITPSN